MPDINNLYSHCLTTINLSTQFLTVGLSAFISHAQESISAASERMTSEATSSLPDPRDGQCTVSHGNQKTGCTQSGPSDVGPSPSLSHFL